MDASMDLDLDSITTGMSRINLLQRGDR